MSRSIAHWSRGVQISGVRFLELHRIHARILGRIDQGDGVGQVSVVVDADLTDHVDRLVRADEPVADRDGGGADDASNHVNS